VNIESAKRKIMVTQADIARLTKVDRTSVSKILCGSQLEHFSNEVIEKVKDMAVQLGYKHKNFKNSLTIGFLFPSGNDEFLDNYTCSERTMATILGISKTIHNGKHRLQIMNFDYSKEAFDFKKIVNSADVFIIWELTWPWANNFYKLLEKKKKNYVVVNRINDEFKGSYIIHEDDDKYINNAVEILVKNGHTKIAGVFGKDERSKYTKTVEKAFKKRSLKFSKENIFCIKGSDAKSCKKNAKLIAEKAFTAVFVKSADMNALNLLIELNKLGLRVPEDISILGNHKKRSLPYLDTNLSSFETPWYDMGKLAADFLIAESLNNGPQKVLQKVLKQKFYQGNTIKKMN
jgi:DNA-binding LacI/PurR family transcriptional regulator